MLNSLVTIITADRRYTGDCTFASEAASIQRSHSQFCNFRRKINKRARFASTAPQSCDNVLLVSSSGAQIIFSLGSSHVKNFD